MIKYRLIIIIMLLLIISAICYNCKFKKVQNLDSNDTSSFESKLNVSDSINKTTNLKDYGNVFINYINYFGKYCNYDSIETYSLTKPGTIIQGIERYGPFRFYNHKEHFSENNYNFMPKIEFLDNKNNILSTANPLADMELTTNLYSAIKYFSGSGDNNFTSSYENAVRYIDPELLDSFEMSEILTTVDSALRLALNYDIQSNCVITMLKYSLSFHDSFSSHGYEIIIYDSLGIIQGRLTGYGPLNNVGLTMNKKYLSQSMQ